MQWGFFSACDFFVSDGKFPTCLKALELLGESAFQATTEVGQGNMCQNL
jgi:hypothetical protein